MNGGARRRVVHAEAADEIQAPFDTREATEQVRAVGQAVDQREDLRGDVGVIFADESGKSKSGNSTFSYAVNTGNR